MPAISGLEMAGVYACNLQNLQNHENGGTKL